VYLVELGAGSGRFAYLFLKKLLALQADALEESLSWRYVLSLRAAMAFLFPIAALRCLRLLHELSDGHLLLLSADKGSIHAQEPREQHPARLLVHGSFSLPVDYRIIGEYGRRRGGEVLHAARHGG